MRALVKTKHGDGFIELKDVEKPFATPDEVIIKVNAAGICGSDIHLYHGGYSNFLNPPVVLGHEFSGTVTKVGENVKEIKQGERVVADSAAHVCGECYYCRTGRYNLCPKRVGLGYQIDGAFAEFVKVPARSVHKMPTGVSYDEGAIANPACTAHYAVTNRGKIKPGDTVVILGPGPIGLLTAISSKLSGASKVFITGLSSDKHPRLEIAKKIGASPINVDEEDAVKLILNETNDFGADVVVDATGSGTQIEQAMKMIRSNGQIVKIGHGAGKTTFNLDMIVYKELTIQGVFAYMWETWEEVLKLMNNGQLDVKPVITHKLPLEKWREGIELVETKRAAKVILIP